MRNNHAMKMGVSFVVALLSISSFIAKADVSVFGNTTNLGTAAFTIIYNFPNPITGAAVEFTPTQNINVNSVSLWLSGYNGQNDQTIYASISLSSGTFLNFSSAAPNDGSLAQFTFSDPSSGNPYINPSDSTILSAGTTYWLVVDSGGETSIGNSAEWVGGNTPTGEAVYNGSIVLDISESGTSSSSVLPAFSINIAPEPSAAAIMMIPFLLGAARKLFKARKPLL